MQLCHKKRKQRWSRNTQTKESLCKQVKSLPEGPKAHGLDALESLRDAVVRMLPTLRTLLAVLAFS